LPGGAIGLIGMTAVAVLAPYVLFSPAELAKPGFKAATSFARWACRVSNSTVWLIFAPSCSRSAYETTGLGRRNRAAAGQGDGRRTLTLATAVAFADLLLAPFTAVQHRAQRRHRLPR